MDRTIRIDTLGGTAVIDDDGESFGKIGQVYLDNESLEPTFVTVKTSLFGGDVLVPIQAIEHTDDAVKIAGGKARLEDAPHVPADKDITPLQEDTVHRYWGTKHGGKSPSGVTYVRSGHDGDSLD